MLRKKASDEEYFKLVFAGVTSVPKRALDMYRDGLTLLEAQAYYLAWKAFDAKATSLNDRRSNLPGYITESLVALCFGAKLIKKGSGDLIFPDRSVGEVKGSSSPGPLSFSPDEWFDNLYYCKYLRDELGTFFIYDLKRNRHDLNGIHMGKGLTFKDQSDAGRRARFSIDTEIIAPENLQPEYMVRLNQAIPSLQHLL